ncbi:unnamed protein product [Candidula unifasciata]|uniref:[acyl-carrier-protein] S-malonyltransferase n=1 Tax=Candidula unifasciata TaxID=100452 RepID=A0A8S3ZCY8_9EUPU|nr:unnamed protein product [Candidula unifasciata]
MTVLIWKQAVLRLNSSGTICGRYYFNGRNIFIDAACSTSMATLKASPCFRNFHIGRACFIHYDHNWTSKKNYSSGTSSGDNSENNISSQKHTSVTDGQGINTNSNTNNVDNCSSATTTTDSSSIEKLPRRVLKRLQKQGISETEFLSRLNASNQATYDTVSAASFTGGKEQLEDMLKNLSTEPHQLSETDSFPSDVKRYKQWQSRQAAVAEEQKIAPSTTSVILFPGQGSQFVGMGKKLLDYPGVRDMYEEASSILGYNLLNLCLRGPKSELDKTVHCQPAVVITSLAAIEKCREEHPNAVEKCVTAAGFSAGEYAALVFSGVMSFPDAVKLLKVRAEAMQKASEQVGSGMMSVFLAHDSDLTGAIKMAKEYCIQRRNIDIPVCTVANYLFPECKILAGHEEALEFIATNAKEFNILRTKRLLVSGAFHTSLMESAVKPLQRALDNMKLGSPKIPVYSNVTSQPYHVKSNYSHMLSQQLVKPVKWEQIMHVIYTRKQGEEFPNTYEVGPGKQMGTLLKQINLQAYKQFYNVDV